jgi:hypothetical protein
MKQVLNIPPMFLGSLRQHAIFLELYNVAKSVDPIHDLLSHKQN